MSLKGSLPKCPGKARKSLQKCFQQREVLAVVVVSSNLCQGWEEREDFVSHNLLLAQLCQEMDTTERERTYRNSVAFVYTATILNRMQYPTELTHKDLQKALFLYTPQGRSQDSVNGGA